MKTRTLLAAVATTSLIAGSASAAITVDGTTNWFANSGTLSGTFDASGSDKLVVIVTGEHGFPNNAGGDVTSVTYDGVELIEVVDRDPIIVTADPLLVDQTYNSIFYLDNPGTSTGAIVANVATRGNVSVIALSGTAAGVGNTVIGAANSSSADLTTSAGSIVIASYGQGGFGNTATIGNDVVTDAPLVEIARSENGSNWDGHVTGYANNVAAGTATYSWTDPSTTGAHVIAAEFLVVPEPGSLALLGLGGLLIARRRRG